MILLSGIQGVYAFFIEPFVAYAFLRKALVGCCALSLSCGPLGCFMVLRRMSLVGDALSHGLLPGIAVAFLISGFSIMGLSIGGLIAGLLMAWGATLIQAKTRLSEDSTFAACFTLAMAFGLLILSIFGSHVDIMHILLGTVLAISRESLLWICVVSSVSLILVAFLYRPLVLRAFDLPFFESVGGQTQRLDFAFMALVTLNLVSAFQALGTLMALGLLLVPAITARLFCQQVWTLACTAVVLSLGASYFGLVIAYHAACPCGPAIILTAGVFYLVSLINHLLKPSRRLLKGGVSLGALGALGLLALGAPPPLPRVPVVASFTILADFVRELAGPDLPVASLVGVGSDPHVYEPSPREIVQLLKADLVIVNGLGLEHHWLHSLLKSTGFQGRVVVASEGCRLRTLTMGSQEVTDPHAWQDVANARQYVRTISQALQQVFPSKGEAIGRRAGAYDQKLSHLHHWIGQQIARVPVSQRRMLTTHDGLGYFAQAYGITCLSPWGLSTEGEPSPQALAGLLENVRTHQVRVLFLENMLSPQLMSQIAQTEGLGIGGTLYVDGLSGPGGPAGTYMAMMRHNVGTLVRGLLA